MKHVLVVAHPNPSSFTHGIAHAYGEAVAALGHDHAARDLYAIGFDPRLPAEEIPGHKHYSVRDDVIAEREILRTADIFAFFYPLWINSPPAILKGYFDRVFGFGFAYGRKAEGNVPLLTPRKMISFTSSGAPQEWLMSTGSWDAMRTLFDQHFAGVCGLTVVDHVHFGRIVPGMRPDVFARHVETTRAAVVRNF